MIPYELIGVICLLLVPLVLILVVEIKKRHDTRLSDYQLVGGSPPKPSPELSADKPQKAAPKTISIEEAFLGFVRDWSTRTESERMMVAATFLQTVKLESANLENIDVPEIDLSKACLRQANLRGANLSRAMLWSADLSGADLSYSNMQNAILPRANLSNANLSHANLKSADLSEAHLDGTKLEGTQYSLFTRWPKGFDPDQFGAQSIDGTNPLDYEPEAIQKREAEDKQKRMDAIEEAKQQYAATDGSGPRPRNRDEIKEKLRNTINELAPLVNLRLEEEYYEQDNAVIKSKQEGKSELEQLYYFAAYDILFEIVMESAARLPNPGAATIEQWIDGLEEKEYLQGADSASTADGASEAVSSDGAKVNHDQTTTEITNSPAMIAEHDTHSRPYDANLELLRRLAELRDIGTLTEEEFQSKKAEILKRI